MTIMCRARLASRFGCEVEPVTLGAPAGCGDRRGCAQMSEGRLSAEPVDVLARGDEQGRGVVSAAPEP